MLDTDQYLEMIESENLNDYYFESQKSIKEINTSTDSEFIIIGEPEYFEHVTYFMDTYDEFGDTSSFKEAEALNVFDDIFFDKVKTGNTNITKVYDFTNMEI